MENEKSILGLSRVLFWDVDPQKIDLQKHAEYVIERVLTRGTWAEFKIILNFYGRNRIKRILKGLRYLNSWDLNFCCAYFNIPIKEFRAYHIRKSRISCWDY